MTSPTSKLCTRWKVCAAMGLAAIMLLNAPRLADAQVVQGVEKGVREGNKAAGPVGGVLGGAIGGVVGVVTGVTGVLTGGNNNTRVDRRRRQRMPSRASPPSRARLPSKASLPSRVTRRSRRREARLRRPPRRNSSSAAVLTQAGAPQLTAEQIVANSDANIERIKKELNLTPEQEKHWAGFNSAMHYLGHNGADRLNLRVARAKRDPPDDIIEQMRNEAQFLNDRAVDQRNVADAAEPLFTSLNDKQKAALYSGNGQSEPRARAR